MTLLVMAAACAAAMQSVQQGLVWDDSAWLQWQLHMCYNYAPITSCTSAQVPLANHVQGAHVHCCGRPAAWLDHWGLKINKMRPNFGGNRVPSSARKLCALQQHYCHFRDEF